MRSTSWTEAHDRLLRDAAPVADEPSSEDLARIWERVAPTVAARGARRRRRLRVGIAAGVGAVVLGTSGLAVAAHYTAHTGRGPLDAEDLRLGGPGERLALAAPDYGQVVAEETADIPFPSDEARAAAVQQQVHDARFAGTDEAVATGAVRAWVADAALCSWSNQWAVATRSGDDAGRDEAIEMVRAAPTWPAVTALDPHPSSRREKVQSLDRQGHSTTTWARDDSQFYYLAALGDAVEGRDPSAVAAVLAADNGYCDASVNVPDLPTADPLHGAR